jgi:hypothetical protein
VQLRIQRQQAAPEKTRQRKAEEEKQPLKVPLPTMAQNHHHPEKRKQRSRRQHNQSEIQCPLHPIPRQTLQPTRKQGNIQVQGKSGIRNYLQIQALINNTS